MEAREFIIDRLKNIFSSFNNINIKYEYKSSINTHIIEVKPIDVFQNNTEYIDMEIDLEEQFSEQFPTDEILFVTEDSLNNVNSPILELVKVSETLEYSQTLLSSLFGINNIINLEIKAGENNYALAA